MQSYLKIFALFTAAIVGLVGWNMVPELRPIMTLVIAASLICYLVSALVGVTVKRVMSAEQLELRSRLELLDRKVTALLKEAVEQRKLR